MDGRTRRVENILAHTFGMVFAVLIFMVYTFAKGGIEADYVQIAATLLLFGVVYEVLSWLFFNLFKFFSNSRRTEGEVVTVQAGEPTELE